MTVKEIADAADVIIDGYAVELLERGVRITNLHDLDHVTFVSPKGEVLETTMDDIELHIAMKYYDSAMSYVEDDDAKVL